MPDWKLWLQAVGRGSRGMLQAAKQLRLQPTAQAVGR